MAGSDGDDDHDDESNDGKNREGTLRKLAYILLLTLLVAFSIARQIVPTTKPTKSNVTISGENVRAFGVGSTSARTRIPAAKLQNVSRASPSLLSTSSRNQEEQLTAASLPIYLLRSSTNQTARTTWGTLAEQWNRTTQYEHLFESATPVSSLPVFSTSPSMLLSSRTVVVIHCTPKTGSTTLRVACKWNYQKTCEGIQPVSTRTPVGLKDGNELYPLIRRCVNTTHFCAKEVDMPPSFDDVPPYEGVLFVHMFPFRNYDEWAASALKQQHDRGGEKGCDKAREGLEKCEPSRMELDLRKYGKTELSRFKEGVVQRMQAQKGEDHVFLLYHHRELNDILATLSDVYDIPLLPGSDGKGKEKRPEGTCDADLLRMFHDCFSSELMELS